MNSNSIYKEIDPTVLYVKQHSITGKKYFGKTTNKDPYKYQGSGKYWKSHYKKHGKEHIKTLWVSELFTDKDLLVEFALLASDHWNIVDSDDWANLKPENGLDGGCTPESARKGLETKQKNRTHPRLGPLNTKKKNGTHHLLSGEMQRKAQNKRVADGTHHLLGPAVNLKRIEDGTHHLLGPEFNLKRVADGTHPFLGKGDDVRIRNLKMVKDGTHPFLSKKENPLWLEVKQLHIILGIKIPNGTWVKNNESLIIIRDDLLKCLNNNRN